MKIGIVVGTRPEIIKMSPVIKECQRRNIDFFIVHSNQHYSKDMDQVFFEDLELPEPNYNLNIGKSGGHANQTGNILIKIEPIFKEEKPDIVLVQGDTNTVASAALAAAKLNIKVGHVEAGLRSYDKTMPEETNRVITDHMSEYLFAVSGVQEKILLNEGVDKKHIHIVGNTISDAILSTREIASSKSKILEKNNLSKKDYFIVTAHRASNVDSEANLSELLETLNEVSQRYKTKMVWPMHPRTKVSCEKFNLKVPENILILPPLSYLDFTCLLDNSKLIITDSGGLQEEGCILGVPCITIRENTERPETVNVGANILTGRNKQKVITAIDKMLSMDCSWTSPFGDGNSSKYILDIITGEKSDSVLQKEGFLSVIGLGYMGLPTSNLLATSGYKVVGVDINEEKVNKINAGQCPFDEAGMQELLEKSIASGNFCAQTSLESSDVYFIAVPTPSKDKKCDLRYVESALEMIGKVVKDGQLVILESTVKPGTCRDVIKPYFDKLGVNVEISHCPERAIPGQTLYEIINNDRIIGGLTEAAANKTEKIYASFVKGEMYKTDATVAETTKLVENTFRDINIAFANELSAICDELNVDVFEVIKFANKHPRVNVLTPGPGVGGHCIAIDPWFLTEDSKVAQLIATARKVNDDRPSYIVDKIQNLYGKEIKTVGVLGVAYKKNVDDCRETPALHIADHLKEKGYEVKAHDPFVKSWDYELVEDIDSFSSWADLVVVVTDHDCFKTFSRDKKIFDTRNLF